MQESKPGEILKKFEEVQFLGQPKSVPEQLLLFLHSINVSSQLICTGLLEDDPMADYVLPPDWSSPLDNVYSFRYQGSEDKNQVYYFKICFEEKADVFFCNAVSSAKPDSIISFEIKNVSSYKNYQNSNTNDLIHSLIKNYRANFLSILTKKPQKQTEKTVNTGQDQRPVLSFWNRPRNNEPSPFVPSFGDYGSSDLRPIPLGGTNSGGSLLGPNNPIFLGQQNPNSGGIGPMGIPPPGPGIRFDPFGPDGINGTFSRFDGGVPKNPRFDGGAGGGYGGFF